MNFSHVFLLKIPDLFLSTFKQSFCCKFIVKIYNEIPSLGLFSETPMTQRAEIKGNEQGNYIGYSNSRDQEPLKVHSENRHQKCQNYPILVRYRRNILLFCAYLLEKIINSHLIIKILGKIATPPKTEAKLKVAIIPDGNRRYHKKLYQVSLNDTCSSDDEVFFSEEPSHLNETNHISIEEDFTEETQLKNRSYFIPEVEEKNKIGGKWHGIQTLANLFIYLRYCDEVTVYCYSLQNFKNRNEKELKILMKLLSKIDVRKLKGQIRIIGATNLLREKYQNILKRIEHHSNSNPDFDQKKANFLLIYSGLDELNGKYGEYISQPDILIRTGYQKRLSDFLLKQCANGVNITFIDCFWPELTEWHIFLVIIKYFIEKQL